jgi:hypothetical protein
MSYEEIKMRHPRSLLFLLILLVCPGFSPAQQLWSGIVSPLRATDWTQAGVVGGIPDANWAQCGSTITPSTGTAATINKQIAGCPPNTYVLLGPGTFNLSTGILMKSNVVLRGSGANSTFLIMAGANGCGGSWGWICFSQDPTWFGYAYMNTATWSGSYAQGATSITLAGLSKPLSVGQYIYLDQADDVSDPGTLFVCESTTASPPCSLEGAAGAGRKIGGVYHNQIQIVKITKIEGSNYTIEPGLYGIRWSANKSSAAWWPNTTTINAGVENLSVDTMNSPSIGGVVFSNAANCWVRGIRSLNGNRNHAWLLLATHITVQDSYFYGTKKAASKSYGVESFGTTDDLIVNNIFQKVSNPVMLGPSQGSVYAYNFSINDFINLPTFLALQNDGHDAGVLYNLFEGNIGAGFYGDIFHGTGGANTFFRNRWNGHECTGGICTMGGDFAIRLDSYNRAENAIGNVLGTTGIHKSYENGTNPPIYSLGHGNTEGAVTVPSDSLVSSTLLRWGNYDTVTGDVRWCGDSSDPGWTTNCGGKSEVPTGLSQYANAVPSSISLPPSFYYRSTPSWWPNGKTWPPIGPEVSSGNLGLCTGGTYPYNMATSSAFCTGGTFTASDAGGHANSNPAMDCYVNAMGGPPDGSGSALSFNASACYSHSAVAAPKDLAAIVQ